MSDPLRPYWDFDDLDATEVRFRDLRAEVMTQLARVQGLREDYESGERLLDEVTEQSPRVRIRVDLERGRLRRSAGDKDAALPFFERAFATAVTAGEDWLAGDAAHMAALAAPDREAFAAWTNNLGWEHFDAQEYERALELFEQALVVREREPDNAAAIQHAREAVADARKALGRG